MQDEIQHEMDVGTALLWSHLRWLEAQPTT